LVHDMLPEMFLTPEGKEKIRLLLADILDGHRPESFDFFKFLWLMRRCRDLRDERDVVLEAIAVKECGYEPDEVEQLRHLFLTNMDWAGELGCEALRRLLVPIIELTEKEQEELSELLREVSPVKRESVRFPQFLRLVKMLTQRNALGLNDAAARALRCATRRRSMTVDS